MRFIYDFFMSNTPKPTHDSHHLILDRSLELDIRDLDKSALISRLERPDGEVKADKVKDYLDKLIEKRSELETQLVENYSSVFRNSRFQLAGFGTVLTSGGKLIYDKCLYLLSSDENASSPSYLPVFVLAVVGAGFLYLVNDGFKTSKAELHERIKRYDLEIEMYKDVLKQTHPQLLDASEPKRVQLHQV